MRIRWKLLILFLVIALLPVGFLRISGAVTVENLKQRIVLQMRETLARDSRQRMKLLVENSADILRQVQGRVEMALSVQVKEVRRCLEIGGATEQECARAIMESFEPWLKPVVVARYAAFKDGGSVVLPGQDRQSGDARQDHWYRRAMEVGRLVWSGPLPNPATGRMAEVVSMPLVGPDGGVIGAMGLVVGVDEVLTRERFTRHLTPGAEAFVVVRMPEPGGVKLFVASRQLQGGSEGTWKSGPDMQWLESTSREEFAALLDDIGKSRVSVRLLEHDGRDCLWAQAGIDDDVALVVVAPLQGVMAPAERVGAVVQGLIDYQMRIMGYAAAVMLFGVMLLALAFSRTLTRPIHALAKGAERLAAGDFDSRVDISSRDEIGDMGRVFNMVGPRLKAHEHVRQALAVAEEVQQNLLPRQAPKIDGLDLAGASIYSDETGGDYYDFLCADAQLAVVVGDVAGHGIGAALLMTTARALVRERLSREGDLASALACVNRNLSRDVGDSGRFMTMFCVKMDREHDRLEWARAGHEPGLVYDPESDTFSELGGRGIPLGVLEEARYDSHQGSLRTGQVIVLGTDGIWEARNPSGEMFGREAFRNVVREYHARPAADLVDAVFRAVREFTGEREQEDDVTLAVIRVVEREGLDPVRLCPEDRGRSGA